MELNDLLEKLKLTDNTASVNSAIDEMVSELDREGTSLFICIYIYKKQITRIGKYWWEGRQRWNMYTGTYNIYLYLGWPFHQIITYHGNLFFSYLFQMMLKKCIPQYFLVYLMLNPYSIYFYIYKVIQKYFLLAFFSTKKYLATGNLSKYVASFPYFLYIAFK